MSKFAIMAVATLKEFRGNVVNLAEGKWDEVVVQTRTKMPVRLEKLKICIL